MSERIESKEAVQTYLDRLRYALDNGAQVTIQMHRRVDMGRDIRQTNRYTIADLLPDEDPVEAMKREPRRP